MSLGSFIRKQFIDVIQWPHPSEDLLVWRFPMQDEEIQNGASLTVRESQMALFVNEGIAADAFAAGMYKLNTNTLPVLTNLKNWDKLFESPFKSDVYFFNTKLQLSRRWGTAQPVTIRDKDFGMVSVRSFGMYSYRLINPALFFKEISGVVSEYSGATLEDQLRNIIVTHLSSAFGTSDIPFIDMAANQVLLSQKMKEVLTPSFERMGLLLEHFTVESVTLPETLQKKLEERISMGIIGDMNRYTQYQTATSIPLAAQNEGGLAGIGAGLAAGMGMGQLMTNAMTGANQTMQQAPQQVPQQPPQAAPTPQTAAEAPEQKLAKLKMLLDQELISQDDYNAAKAEVLKQLLG